MPKASINTISTIMQAARSSGVDLSALLAEFDLCPAHLKDPHKRIACEDAFRFMERAQQQSGDPFFGLHYGTHFQLVGMGLTGYLMLSAPTAFQGLEAFCRYQQAFGEGLQLHAAPEGDALCLTLARHEALLAQPGRHTIEGAFSALVNGLQRLIGPDVQPLSVTFRHAPPENLAPYQSVFRCPVTFEQPTDSIRFDQHWLHQPLYQCDPMVFQWAEARLQQLLAHLQESALSQEVGKAIVQQLHAGRPTMTSVAGRLGLSPRTLQRRLQSEGASFQSILDKVRQQLAQDALKNEATPVEEIAFWLGFSDASAFRKTFRRWTGKNPAAYRQG